MFTRMGLLFLCLTFFITMPAASAQSPTNNWQIPDIGCGEGCKVWQKAVDAQGNLYLIVWRYQPVGQVLLYRIPYGSDQIFQYDMVQLYAGKFVRSYIVPFSDDKVIVYNYQGVPLLSLLNLQTQTVTPLDVGEQSIQDCEHNSYIDFTPSIYRVGSDKVLFCSVRDGLNYINLAHLENEALVIDASFNKGLSLGPASRPWRFMTGGMDGKIYFSPSMDDPILAQVAPHYTQSNWSPNYLIMRYDPATQQWDTLYIGTTFERWGERWMAHMTATRSPLIGVDAVGNLYFWNENTALGGVQTYDLVKYNPQGRKVWHLTEADFGGAKVYYHPLLLGENQFVFNFGEGNLRYVEQEDGNGTPLSTLTDSSAVDQNEYPTTTSIQVQIAPETAGSIVFE